MCTKEEVKEVVDAAIAPLLLEYKHIAISIIKIEQIIKELPCTGIKEDMIALKIKFKMWEDENTHIFERLREVESSGSIKIKHIITLVVASVISAIFAIGVYKYTRG